MKGFKYYLIAFFCLISTALAQNEITDLDKLQERLAVLELAFDSLDSSEASTSKSTSNFDQAIYKCCADMASFDSCCAKACDLIWGPGGHVCRAECAIGAVHKLKCRDLSKSAASEAE